MKKLLGMLFILLGTFSFNAYSATETPAVADDCGDRVSAELELPAGGESDGSGGEAK